MVQSYLLKFEVGDLYEYIGEDYANSQRRYKLNTIQKPCACLFFLTLRCSIKCQRLSYHRTLLQESDFKDTAP